MPCYYPMQGWISKTRNKSGKRSVVFKWREGFTDRPINVPCGQCIGCRLEYSRQWAIRCMHEAEMHEDNCFITLTYDDDHLPKNGSLTKNHFTKFIKRLRKAIPNKIRYFHCGEYGDENFRPHHHALIFGYDFPDKYFWNLRNNNRMYRSDMLEKLWSDPKTKENYGFSLIGSVTFESAAYVARYVVKKMKGKNKEVYYGDIVPEYVTMSRRPGIGQKWFEKYKDEVYQSDEVVIRNDITCKPPKYYDNLYDLTEPKKYASLKYVRQEKAKNNPDNHPRRLNTRAQVKKARVTNLKRSL